MMNKILVMTVVGTLALTPLAFTPRAYGALGDPLYFQFFNNTGNNLPVSDFGWRQDYDGGGSKVEDTGGGGLTNLADTTYGIALDEGMIVVDNEGGTEFGAFWFDEDTGTVSDASGKAFGDPIDVATATGLSFTVSIQEEDGNTDPYFFLVQMNGSDWYRSTTAITTDAPDNGTGEWQVVNQAFDPAAANWIEVTISEDGSETLPTEVGAAGGNLTGDLTGAGFWTTYPNGVDMYVDSFFIHDNTSNTPGDVNGSTVADADDLAVIAAMFLNSTAADPSTARSQGDLNLSGEVGFDDFFIWKEAFLAAGGSSAVVAAGLAALTASVPEPSSAVLAMMAMVCGLGFTRRRKA